LALTTIRCDAISIALGAKRSPATKLRVNGSQDRLQEARLHPNTDAEMYVYRYKDDPKSYPKVVGPMAQDLENVLPGITKLIGGHIVGCRIIRNLMIITVPSAVANLMDGI
jgi:hypothetical protein